MKTKGNVVVFQEELIPFICEEQNCIIHVFQIERKGKGVVSVEMI